jgi:oxygen-independent coproporphyrinogen-3 oxidase
VNRLSIGIQSFNAEKLQQLGRVHNSHEAIKAAHTAKLAGFDNFNLDLMHGLPTQTVEDAMMDLQQAFALQPTHLSWYQLTLEPNTLFHAKPPILPDEETLWEIQTRGQDFIAQQGFQRYEVSAYNLPGKQCRHNMNYWQFGDYLGIGAGAHSKITLSDNSIVRLAKTKHPKDYLDPTTPFISEQRVITEKDLPFEFMLNALRLNQVIPLSLFIERTGLSATALQPALKIAAEKELLTFDDSIIFMTNKGRLFVDEVTQLFLQT